MTNDNLPNIISTLTDGNLDTSRRVDLGDRVLILGTSTRGPKNQPIKCNTPTDAASVFGPIANGTLVKGFSEVYYGPNGVKDIWCCRITNGNKASVEIVEKDSAVLEDLPTTLLSEAVTALTVEALEAGDIYNSVSFREEIVNGQLSVVCYNPVTGLETVIPYDATGVTTGSVKDVSELADAINLDPNMGRIVTATANEINMTATFTITSADVAASGTMASLTGNTLELDLGEALDVADTGDDGYTDDTSVVSPSGVPVTSGNKIIRLNEVYELSNELVELHAAGLSSVALPYPCQTLSDVALTWLGLDGSVSGGGKAKHLVVNAYIGTGDADTKTFPFTAYEEIDTSTFILYRTSAAGVTVEVAAADYDLTSVGGVANDYIASITFKTAVTAPAANAVLTVEYDSEEFSLTKAASLAACRASSSYKTYFAAGDRVNFGTAQPCDIEICYPAKKTFYVDVDVVVSDEAGGKILFGNPEKLPAYTGASGSQIYVDWDYQPEWIDLGTGAKSLQGGSNGTKMTTAQKYTVLTETYAALADFECDCVVLMNTYINDVKTVYDEETGLPVTVNAGFGSQLEAFLESLQDGVNETYGIMAVSQAASSKLADVATWVLNLTEVNTSDKTRAANVMATANYKHVSVVAFEPVVANGAFNIPYITTGEAIYAGLVCKLPITSAPTNKSLGSQVLTCRFKLSPRQLDALTAARYVTTTLTPENEWKITDGVTAAAATSDYTRLSTIRIVFAAMDVVRSSGRPFIGELFHAAKRAALDTAIQKGLMAMQEEGALVKFNFKIEQTAAERALGIARVNLTLWPEFELRRIEVTIKLSNS